MKTNSALIRTDGAVELHPESAIDLNLAFIIYPRNTEHNNTLRLGKALEQCAFLILGMRVDGRL